MSLRLAVALAAAGVLLVAVVVSAPAQSHASRSCASVAVLLQRGSGDVLGKDRGFGAPGLAFWSTFAPLVPASTAWANPYNAVGVFSLNLKKFAPQLLNGIGAGTKLSGLGLGAYHDSVVGGETQLEQKLAQLVSECSKLTAVVLVGYSQGAQVAADVYQRDLTAHERRMLAGVVLFGDTYFNRHDSTADRGSYSGRRGGLFGERPLFQGPASVFSYCHSHDPICQGVGERIGPIPVVDPGSLTFKQHTNYAKWSNVSPRPGKYQVTLR
jgi:hypothetical protein